MSGSVTFQKIPGGLLRDNEGKFFKVKNSNPGGGGTRDPWLLPFTGPFTVPISTAVQFEAVTGPKTVSFRSRAGATPPANSPTTGRMGSATVNGGVNNDGTMGAYGVTAMKAKSTDPLVTVTDTQHGQSIRIRIPANLVPPTGLDMNTAVGGPDGKTWIEFYKFAWTSGTTATCTRIIPSQAGGLILGSLYSSGIDSGVRAFGGSMLNGLIRRHEIDAVLAGTATDFGHALAMSIPKEHFKRFPVAADGQVVNGKAIWPGNTQDNQNNVPYGYTNSSGTWIDGAIPMGALFAIPLSANALGAVSSTDLLARALANTLTKYGVYVTDQSSTWALYIDQDCTESHRNAIRTPWRNTLMGMCRFVTSNRSSTPGGGPNGTPRLAPDALELAA